MANSVLELRWRAWERCSPNICFEMQLFLCAKTNRLFKEVIYSPVFFKTGTHMCTYRHAGPSRTPQSAGNHFHVHKSHVQREGGQELMPDMAALPKQLP